jgi:hypothetical protein
MQNYCEWCHQADDLPIPLLKLTGEERARPELRCPRCERSIILVDVSTACALIGKSQRTLYRWINDGWVTSIPLAASQRLIVYSSLFDKPLQKFDVLTGEAISDQAQPGAAQGQAVALRLAAGG